MSVDFVIISLQNPVSSITEKYIEEIKSRLNSECPHINLEIDTNTNISLPVKQKRYKLEEKNMIFVDDSLASKNQVSVKFFDTFSRTSKCSLDDFVELLKSFEPENDENENNDNGTCKIM